MSSKWAVEWACSCLFSNFDEFWWIASGSLKMFEEYSWVVVQIENIPNSSFFPMIPMLQSYENWTLSKRTSSRCCWPPSVTEIVDRVARTISEPGYLSSIAYLIPPSPSLWSSNQFLRLLVFQEKFCFISGGLKNFVPKRLFLVGWRILCRWNFGSVRFRFGFDSFKRNWPLCEKFLFQIWVPLGFIGSVVVLL